MGKLSKSDEQLSSLEQDSGQCSRNTSCETLGKNAALLARPLAHTHARPSRFTRTRARAIRHPRT